MVMEDDSILMLSELDIICAESALVCVHMCVHMYLCVPGGEGVKWVREEGLGTVTALQFLDLPADQSAMVEDFLERTKSELNPISLALQRWQLQAQLFKVGPSSLSL